MLARVPVKGTVTDRRRAPRYVLYTTVAAILAPLQDIVVEQVLADRLVAICPTAARPTETLAVQFAASEGELVTLDADVVTSEPVMRADRIGFRVELHVPSGPRALAADGGRALAGHVGTADAPLHAVLMRRHSVGIRDISGVGCLVDAYVPFARGTIALLETRIDERRCIEAARIARTGGGNGGRGTYLIGAEFLPLSPAGTTSVRAAIATLDARTRGGNGAARR